MALVLLGPSTAGSAVGAPPATSPALREIAAREIAASIEYAQTAESAQAPAAPLESSFPEADPFPGHTYGNKDGKSCIRELDAREVPYERYGYARGVETPVRLMGPLHGVIFMHAEAPDWLTSARREVLDCRLVLALDDLAGMVAKHGVTQVLHYGIYRGDVPLPAHGKPRHHVAGLAIDVAAFVKEDATRLEVRRDWAGRVGARACGEGASPLGPAKESSSAELRGILCDLVKERMFHQVLTPNHDMRHRDHFHLEVMRNTSWTLVQ
jgi:hypothetical protein